MRKNVRITRRKCLRRENAQGVKEKVGKKSSNEKKRYKGARRNIGNKNKQSWGRILGVDSETRTKTAFEFLGYYRTVRMAALGATELEYKGAGGKM